jgi:hypothetical protein
MKDTECLICISKNKLTKVIHSPEFIFTNSKDNFYNSDSGIYKQSCVFINQEPFKYDVLDEIIELLDDNHFTYHVKYLNKQIEYKGNWSFKNKTIDLFVGDYKPNVDIIIRFPIVIQDNKFIIKKTQPIKVISPDCIHLGDYVFAVDLGYIKK